MKLRQWIRMANWARNPPSQRRVAIYLGTIAAALAIAGLEALGFWPDWARLAFRP